VTNALEVKSVQETNAEILAKIIHPVEIALLVKF
jgi:hypothetical protein